MNLWSTKAKQGNALHRICAYQGSFPPQLPAFFLDRYPNSKVVYDPFSGRGTTVLEAVLRGKTAYARDVLPVARLLSNVKLHCLSQSAVLKEIERLDLSPSAPAMPDMLKPFYHRATWPQLFNLKEAKKSKTLIALALGRMHGHSSGFFSTETFNVISLLPESVRRLQKKHGTRPEPRDVKAILERAARRFLPAAEIVGSGKVFLHEALPAGSVDLVITSPPFLDVIDYDSANWLRGWFLGGTKPTTFIRDRVEYEAFIKQTLTELTRVLAPKGRIVFEIGPVKRDLALADVVTRSAVGLLTVEEVLVNDFSAEAVPKMSRAMHGGGKTTTMRNHCVILRKGKK